MILDDLGDYLSTGGITGTIYKGFMPNDPDDCVAIYETGGQAPVHAMNGSAGQAVLERPRVQIVCRSGEYDYSTARTKAQSVFVLMDGMPTRTLNGVAYKWAAAVHSPFLMGRDEHKRPLIACNFDVSKAVG